MLGKLIEEQLILASYRITYEKDGKNYTTVNPSEELLRDLGYKEVVYDENEFKNYEVSYEETENEIRVHFTELPYEEPIAETYEEPYEQKVIHLIREKYTIDQELAILRQRDTKPSEFKEYFDFVESCKERAKN